MKFASVEEYFYKLQNVLYVLLLIPLLSFIYLFAGHFERFIQLDDKQPIVIGLLAFIAVVDWIIITLLFRSMVNKISKLVGLNLKLERYYSATLIRYSVSVASCLILALGFYITDSSIFIGLFGMAIISFFVTWPRPAKVCNDLRLKGDEREMVFYKKHIL
jgi:hypothetical protein